MAKVRNILVTLTALVVFGAIFASSASAYGQCGGSVSTGSQLYNSWQSMGVVSQAEDVVKSAGFHRMDGSLKSWMEERVVKAKLASSAAPVDFGCNPGTLFSVGHRTQAKGTPVMVALPSKYAKTDIRTTPHKGYKRVVVSVHIVGKTDCSNPEEGVVRVVFYIKIHKHHKPHHCKCHKHKPKPKPPCDCQPNIPPKESGSCNGNNVNNGNGSAGNCGVNICVGQNNCNVTPPPEEPCGCIPKPTIKITGKTELNMIPAGKTSGDFYINTYASESGGTLTVDPGIGGVSSCSSSTPEGSFTTSVPSGASKECVILYAPEDKDKPASMTVTMTACLGAVCDEETETVPITYPIRP